MSSTALPCVTASPALLLIEPMSAACAERTAQLERSDCCVTQADNPKDIYLMRHAFHFTVAVVNDAVGSHALRAFTQLVRSQWPYARILILGSAPRDLEDYLYDDVIVAPSREDALAMAVHKLLEDVCQQPGDSGARLAAHGRLNPRQIASWIVQESDPTKAPRTMDGAPVARSWPAAAGGSHSLRQ